MCPVYCPLFFMPLCCAVSVIERLAVDPARYKNVLLLLFSSMRLQRAPIRFVILLLRGLSLWYLVQ